MSKGKFIISLDFELMWGLAGHDADYLRSYAENVKNAPEAIKHIIAICSKYGVKLTIAHVGAIAQRQHSDIHPITPPHLQPTYHKPEFFSGSISEVAPDIAGRDDLFCCPELLQRLARTLNVELGSHTYSHYYCLEDGQKPEQFEHDTKMAIKNAVARYKTIIFPRNQVSEEYLEICARHGFTHYRGILEDFLHKPSKTESHFSLKGALRLMDAYLPITGHKTFKTIEVKGGLRNVPGSMFLRPYSRKLRLLEPLKVSRLKRAMLHAAKKGEYFHLWWHPHNYGKNMSENLSQLEQLCNYFYHLQKTHGMQSYFISEL